MTCAAKQSAHCRAGWVILLSGVAALQQVSGAVGAAADPVGLIPQKHHVSVVRLCYASTQCGQLCGTLAPGLSPTALWADAYPARPSEVSTQIQVCHCRTAGPVTPTLWRAPLDTSHL